jgi:steroid-24-oyl-CoA synthetase
VSATVAVWGDQIEAETVRGITFRTYTQRPHDVAELLDFASRWSDRPHLVQGDTVVSFADLRIAIEAKAAQLAAIGPRLGDRVVLLGWNSPQWIINFWACIRIGAVPVLANPWWGESELADCVLAVAPALVLADARGVARLPAGTPTGPWENEVRRGSTPIPVAARPAATDEDAAAVIVFTSGTAGRPKGVVLSHRSLLSGLHMLLHITRRLPHQVDESTGDTALHTGPMFHIGGVQTLLRAITVGDTLVMPSGRFEPAEALRLIEQWRIVRWSAVPTMVLRVMEHPDVHRRDLTSLRAVTVGGAPVHPEFLAQLRVGLPGVEPRVATGYGLTENGGQATAASGRDTAELPGTCGRALPCVEVRTLSDGEIVVRSPTQMIGYFGLQETPISDDGWLHTGDLGRIDAHGCLWITGRAKDMIIRGGENIAPTAVEEALAGVPGVVESAVFGLPHPDLGEEVAAAVVVDGGVTEEDLREGLRPRVASFAIPTRWLLQHDPLPTNHSGKIDKTAVAAQALAQLTGGRA